MMTQSAVMLSSYPLAAAMGGFVSLLTLHNVDGGSDHALHRS